MTAGAGKSSDRSGENFSKEAALGAIVFVAALVVMLPASALVPFMAKARADIGYRSVEGTIWNGAVRDFSIDGVDLGDVRFKAKPLSLLTGALGVDLNAAGGALEGKGAVALRMGGGVEIKNATATLALDAVRRYWLLGAPVGGAGRASIDRLAFSKSGCRAAQGALETDVLNGPLMRLDRAALDLAGSFECDGADLLVRLSGANAKSRVSIVVRVRPDLQYDMTVNVAAAAEEVRRALTAFGFEESGGVLVYSLVGVLNGEKA